MKKYNFYMCKKYDQFSTIEIEGSAFHIRIVDMEDEIKENRNLRVFTKIWKKEDETDVRELQLMRDINYRDMRYIFRIPFDTILEDDVICFCIFIIDQHNEVIKRSSIQRILTQPIEIEEDEVKDQLEFDLVQGMLNDISVINANINAMNYRVQSYISQANINSEIYDYIDNRTEAKIDEVLEEKVILEIKEHNTDLVQKNNELLNEMKNELEIHYSNELAEYSLDLLQDNKEAYKEAVSQSLNEKKAELETYVDEKLTEVLTELDNLLGQIAPLDSDI